MSAAAALEGLRDMDGAVAVLAAALAQFPQDSRQHAQLVDNIRRVCRNAIVFAQQASECGGPRSSSL